MMIMMTWCQSQAWINEEGCRVKLTDTLDTAYFYKMYLVGAPEQRIESCRFVSFDVITLKDLLLLGY